MDEAVDALNQPARCGAGGGGVSAPARIGSVCFNDASLSIWEEPGRAAMENAGWESAFKKDVFARIVQQLNRMEWTCEVPAEMVKRYSLSFARNYRSCHKGDLHGELRLSGRHIEFAMWQELHNVSNRNGGRYDFDKEQRMPYLLRLQMEASRRRLRDYLVNVFDGYVFSPEPVSSPNPFATTWQAPLHRSLCRPSRPKAATMRWPALI